MAEQSYDVYAAMQEEEPLATYKKTILGKVHALVLNPFTDEPEAVILSGNPNKKADLPSISVQVWTTKQRVFFERMNRSHFEAGRLIEISSAPKIEPSPNQITDKQINDLLDGRKTKFLAFKNRLNEFTSEAPVFRILNRARELEKSEKLIKHIEERISELQLKAYGVRPDEEEAEK